MVAALSTGLSVNQIVKDVRNGNAKSFIQTLYSDINSELKAGRLTLNKLLSILSTKSNAALMNYVSNNPVISKRLEELNADTALLAAFQAEQNTLESEIANLQSQLAGLGYAGSQKAIGEEWNKATEIKQSLESAKEKYEDLVNRVKGTNFSTTRTNTPITQDLDARTQNIKGGLN